MKKILLLLTITLLSLTSFGQSEKQLDEKNGFRELKFGTHIDSISNLKLIEDGVNNKYYEKTDEKLKIGEYDLKRITYGFYKGRLSFILIEANGYTNSKGILDIFTSQYGEGYKSNKYIEKYYWFGKTITLTYDENSINHNSKISISTDIFDKEKKEDKKSSNEKAKSDL